MFAKIKHLAIVSENCRVLGEFYEKLFGMELGPSRGSAVLADGYLGLNVNGRAPGRQAGFDHFGFDVQDVETVFTRMRAKYPEIDVLQRPGNRSYASISAHDPAGNIFDISQEGMEHRRGVYTEAEREHARCVKHFALRTVQAARVAQFYTDVFELAPLEKAADDPNFYLTDGRITLIVMPWKITDYAGSGIERPHLDHIGFKVENIARLREDWEKFKAENPAFSQKQGGEDPERGRAAEREARLNLFRKCRLGQFQLCDPDGVLIDASEN